jgi:hypothetical protein
MMASLRNSNRSMSSFQNGSANSASAGASASTGEIRVLGLVGSFDLPIA